MILDSPNPWSSLIACEQTRNTMANQNIKKLRVAIIGAGPAGLGAAIEFQKLPFVDLRIYDQATVLREVGTGISLQPNTWRMLDVLDASRNISQDEIFRPEDQHSVQHRWLIFLVFHSW